MCLAKGSSSLAGAEVAAGLVAKRGLDTERYELGSLTSLWSACTRPATSGLKVKAKLSKAKRTKKKEIKQSFRIRNGPATTMQYNI